MYYCTHNNSYIIEVGITCTSYLGSSCGDFLGVSGAHSHNDESTVIMPGVDVLEKFVTSTASTTNTKSSVGINYSVHGGWDQLDSCLLNTLGLLLLWVLSLSCFFSWHSTVAMLSLSPRTGKWSFRSSSVKLTHFSTSKITLHCQRLVLRSSQLFKTNQTVDTWVHSVL